MIRLSPYHEILYNEWRLNPQRSDYNIVFDNACSGYIDYERLAHALKRLSQDYFLLHSHIAAYDDGYYWVADADKIAIQLDYSPSSMSTEALLAYVQMPFDLHAGPLWRVSVPIYWLDTNSCLLGVNEQFFEAIGLPGPIELWRGKSAYDVYPRELAEIIIKHNEKVMRTGRKSGQEEIIKDPTTGALRHFYAVKYPLFDDGKVIGLVGTSVEITAQKEAEALNRENDIYKASVQEQKKFREIIDQAVHDIRSPLASLKMLATYCEHLPEEDRNAFKEVATTISDIANNLLSQYGKESSQSVSANIDYDQAQPCLISLLLMQLLSEKKYEYRQRTTVKFNLHLAPDSYFTCIHVQPVSIKRVLSNLINNAVEALEAQEGEVVLRLVVNANQVELSVEDNGKGMPDEVKNKLLQGVAVTAGKVGGHGIGMQQVLKTLRSNHGQLTIHSTLGHGTTMRLSFAPVPPMAWLATEIHLEQHSLLVILDDDESIHLAWNERFKAIKQQHPGIELHHFSLAEAVIQFITQLPASRWQQVVLLSDYELLKQNLNGLEVIERCQRRFALRATMLVTSHYNNSALHTEAARLNTPILPKPLVAEIPIYPKYFEL